MIMDNLVAYLVSKFDKERSAGHIYTLAISGFPLCGKTIIAQKMQKSSPALMVIEAEFWIKSFEERKRLNVSGVSLQAYEVQKALTAISKLRQGTGVRIRGYSHITKRCSGPAYVIRPAIKGGLILDGCIFASASFRQMIDYHVCLIPADVLNWYRNCVYRDVKERYFEPDFSKWHTKNKFRDMLNILGEEQLDIDELFECHGNLKNGEVIFYYEGTSLGRIFSLKKEADKLYSPNTN